MANQQNPSGPKGTGSSGGKPTGKPASRSKGQPSGKASGQGSGKPVREPAPSREGGSGKTDRKPPRGGPTRSGSKSRPREPKPAASQGPREGRLIAGHDEDLLYGRHAVAEALRAGRRHIRRIFLAKDMDRTGILLEIVSAARLVGCPVVEVPRDRMDDAVGGNHQGVVAQAAQYGYVDLDALVSAQQGDQLYLALDHLQDVQNLGTLMRTAEAMGVTGVLLPGRRSAAITPAVVNASSGAVEHLRIALVTNLAQTLEALKAEGVWVAGLDAAPEAKSLSKTDLTGPLCLVVGAEGAGLSRLARDRCDWLVAIPMVGKVESLNASVAGSIVLAAARQARLDAAERRQGEEDAARQARPDPLAQLRSSVENVDPPSEV